MESLLRVERLSQILTMSTGIFSGMGLGISVVAVPGILMSKDPLPTWRIIYKNGSKIAISTILVSTASGIACYISSGSGRENIGYLVCSIISFSIVPYTGLAMAATNRQLFDLNINEDKKTVDNLIKKWARRHWIRTLAGLTAFGICTFKIGISN